jgi:hypothetical protein
VVGIDPEEDELLAYCFDRAVTLFGASLEHELNEVEAKTKKEGENKRKRIIAKWIPGTSAGEGRKFRDPASSIRG